MALDFIAEGGQATTGTQAVPDVIIGKLFESASGKATARGTSAGLYVTGPNGYAYVYENVGVVADPYEDVTAYVYENVGVVEDPYEDVTVYVYENVGVVADPSRDVTVYVYEGDVDNSDPVPHIWFVRPASGREGDGFSIYGHGFGATNSEFDGHAFLGQQSGWDGESPIDAGYQLSETAWQRIAASPSAYGSTRQINALTGEPDPEHGRIDVTVPVGAQSGVVRVQTVAT